MNDLTPETIAELRRLAEAATPGPWASGDPAFGDGRAQCIFSISSRAMGRDVQGPNLRPALFDVEFIANANPAVVLALLDERDALAAKVERVRALPAKHPAGGWYMTSMRDVLAALDEEPQS